MISDSPLKHYHLKWQDRQSEPQKHLLCLTAENSIDAVREAERYLSESLDSITEIKYEGDYPSYLTCRGQETK